MHFRLTYADRLLSTRNDKRSAKRSLHKHHVRRQFHKQLKRLWSEHPVLSRGYSTSQTIGSEVMNRTFNREGFIWKPLVTKEDGLICALDILMLREGEPGRTTHDIDNRLKTIFDALKMPGGPEELGSGTPEGIQKPSPDENPFFVLLQDDKLITHLSVTSDMLLEPVEGVPPHESVRLVIGVTVRPYTVSMDNLDFT